MLPELIKFYSRINIFKLFFSLLEHFLTTRYQFHYFSSKREKKKKKKEHQILQSHEDPKIQFILFSFYHYKGIITSEQSLHFSRFLLHNRKKVAEGRLFKNTLFVT